MAPIRNNNPKVTLPAKRPMISSENNPGQSVLYSKRKAENSPLNNKILKRPLNDSTNDKKTANVESIINNKNLPKITEKTYRNQITTTNITAPVTRAKSVVSGQRFSGHFAENNISTVLPIHREPLPSVPNVLKASSNAQKLKVATKNTNRVTIRSSQIGQSGIRKSSIYNSEGDKLTRKSAIEKNIVLKENVCKNRDNITKKTLNEKSRTIQPNVSIPKLRLRSSKEEVPEHITKTEISSESNSGKLKTEVTLRRSLRNISVKKDVSIHVSELKEEKNRDIKPVRRSSTRLSLNRKSLTADKSVENGSLYISALEDVSNNSVQEKFEEKNQFYTLSEFDKELLHDPHQVSLYAMEIFEYLKSREANFCIKDYMPRQGIDARMRAVLVDWMVEVQENFELNHETLYLSVKIVDTYLSKIKITKESLQLVGAAALLLSCKYDERLSPLIDDFIFVCDGACTHNDLLAMEQSILKHINFELSFPISYSFLRRYARCARIQMPLLTLARFILELGLMDYSTITLSDSKQAAAALYLAFRMVNHSDWTDSLEYYTGYKLKDFKDIVRLFNNILHKKPSSQLMTIRKKYSHELFFKVAATPLLSNADLNLDD